MNLEELRQTRLEMVNALRKNDAYDGIKRLLTDLYPDDAHFIYELLQNAEDAGASKVRFTLRPDSVEFEHDGGRLFSITDVEDITKIGDSAKKDDTTSIGKFGIGFKAVFAYTSSPLIESGEYHFRIRDLVVLHTWGQVAQYTHKVISVTLWPCLRVCIVRPDPVTWGTYYLSKARFRAGQEFAT